MPSPNELTVTTGACEVVISRVINAPRELVFDAFTNAEHLARWFGPHQFTALCETDPRPGGRYRIAMIGPADGPAEMKGPFPMKGEYLEVARPELLVYTCDLSDHPESWKSMLESNIEDGANTNFLNSVTTVTFEDLNGKTKLTIRSSFESDAVRDGYVKLQMGAGWGQSFEKLESLLAELRS